MLDVSDIMGCSLDSCYPGVSCYDVLAPGTGFNCGDCPEGTTGDGQLCESVLPNAQPEEVALNP